MQNEMGTKRAVVILADGARPDVLERLVRQGSLPAIARAFPGAGRRVAVSGFPSTTVCAFLPILTGCFPGTANVPGIRWFDRVAWSAGWRGRNNGQGGASLRNYVGLESFRVNRDIAPGRPTLFELLQPSVNIFSSVNRGVTSRGNLTAVSRAAWWLFAHETDRWDLVARRGHRHLLASLDLDPRFVFCLIPDIDEAAHLQGNGSETVIAAYRRLDAMVGDLFVALESRGWRDDTLVTIVADHGSSDVHTHLGLPEWVDAMGFRPFYHPRVWRVPFDSAVMVSGNGMAHIYLRPNGRWSAQRLFDEGFGREQRALVEALVERPEVAILATLGCDGQVIVRSRAGQATIARLESGEIVYTSQGADPFGYVAMDGRWHPDAILARTLGTRYPDAPVQLLQLFGSRRTGDVVVAAEVGYDLRDRHERPEHRAGHGSLHADHMMVPWYSTAPLPDRPLRTADVFPAVLRHAGLPIPPGIDGRDLWAAEEAWS